MRIFSECRFPKREYDHYLKIDPDFKNHIKHKITLGFSKELFKHAKIDEGTITGLSGKTFPAMAVNQDEPSITFKYDAVVLSSEKFEELIKVLNYQGINPDSIRAIITFFKENI
jgi:hypothetical protein